jgi:hypothetical protein
VWFNGALAVTGGRDRHVPYSSAIPQLVTKRVHIVFLTRCVATRLVKVWDIGGHPRPQAGSMNVASLEGHETNVRCVAMQVSEQISMFAFSQT